MPTKQEINAAIRQMNGGAGKYRNQFTECPYGHRHRSKREANRCAELNLLALSGAIKHLKHQPRYPLYVNEQLVTTYVADFRYYEDDMLVVEDAKGTPTRDYVIKKKLLKALHNIEVHEV